MLFRLGDLDDRGGTRRGGGRRGCPDFDETGGVLARGDLDVNSVDRTLVLVVFPEAFAEAVSFDADDGIALLVELRRAAERLDGDVVFLDLVGPALEVFAANIFEDVSQIRGAVKDTGGENRLQLSSFALEHGRSLH